MRSLRHVVLSGLLVSLLQSLSPAQDLRAGYIPMLRNSGFAPSSLTGGNPPLLFSNRTPSVVLHGARDYVAGALFISGAITNGLPILVGQDALLLHVQQPVLVLPVAMRDQATFSLPLPQTELLIGVDLAMQAILLTNHARLGATNLLLANIGVQLTGALLANFVFSTTSKQRDEYFKTADGRSAQQLYCNSGTTPSYVVVNARLVRNVVANESVEIRVGVSAATALPRGTISHRTSHTRVCVPAGQYVFLYHTGGNASIRVDYSVTGALDTTSTHVGTGFVADTTASGAKAAQPLFCNPVVTGSKACVLVVGKLARSLTQGEKLEIRVGRSAATAVKVSDVTQKDFNIRVCVQAGECIYLWHDGAASLAVNWTVALTN